jgi:hypothetical protein
LKSPLLKSNIVLNHFANFLKRDSGSCLFFFLVGLILRGIPELLISFYPVGYETIAWYAPPMMTFPGRSVIDVFVEFFRSGPLFYVLMWLVANVTGAHAFVILKVVGPLLYGSLIVSFFVFLKKGLKFDWKMAFVASLLLVFQIAALRDSWDRFRTVLGLGFLFATLTVLKSDNKRKWLLVSVLAFLVTISREYVAAVLFAAVFCFAIFEKKGRATSLIALGPALAIFMVMVFPGLFGVVSNYVPEGQFAGRSYLWVVQDAFVIFAACYLALLPFVIRGWYSDKLIGSITAWLLVGSFSILIPWFAVPGYQRWLLLLVFPFCVYAVKGFERFQLFDKRRIRILAAILLCFIVIGMGYSTGTFSYVGHMTNSYVTVHLVQSSISWDQVDDVKAVLSWLNENAVSNSSVLAEECFYGWTLIYFGRANNDVKVISYGAAASSMPALEMALRDGFSQIYLIWYSEQSLNDFEIVRYRNSIAIFQYAPKGD